MAAFIHCCHCVIWASQSVQTACWIFNEVASGIKFSLGNKIASTDHMPRRTIYSLLKNQHHGVCLFVIRTSCWLSWMSCSRRRWIGACWRSEGPRMSTSPTCLQLRYTPEPVGVLLHASHFLCFIVELLERVRNHALRSNLGSIPSKRDVTFFKRLHE